MEPGWIYVLVNSSIPGLAKVGHTTRLPAARAAELSAATGVATPFVLAFDQPVADCCAAEHAVHAELDRRGLRVAQNREFFRGSPSEIVRIVLDVAGGDIAPPVAGSLGRASSGQTLLEAGDCCLAGLGDTLQDTGEAIRLYKLAASRGATAAYGRLGRIYVRLYVARPGRAARRRALAPLKHGAQRGDAYCYAEMADLFAAERNVGNYAKAWGLFFAGQEGSPIDERLTQACCRYVAACLALRIDPVRNATLDAASRSMMATLVAELGAVRDIKARRRVAAVLRWAYLHFPLPCAAPAAPPPDSTARLDDEQPIRWPECKTLTA